MEPTAQLSQEIRDQARCDLDIIYRRLGETEPSGRRPITPHYVLARLFLRHISVTGGARVARFVYYLFLGVLVFWGIIGFGEPRA